MWRVPKAPSREHGATRQRSGEACNAPQGWSRTKGRVPKAPSVEDSPAGAPQTRSPRQPKGLGRADKGDNGCKAVRNKNHLWKGMVYHDGYVLCAEGNSGEDHV